MNGVHLAVTGGAILVGLSAFAVARWLPADLTHEGVMHGPVQALEDSESMGWPAYFGPTTTEGCAMATTDEVRAAREALVREHMESENRHDFDATLATFTHPHYELIATGEVYDGEEAVRGYYARYARDVPRSAQRGDRAPPHRRRRDRRVRSARYAHRRARRDGDPTGREFRCRMIALFLFDGDLINCERVYFDSGTILRQLGLADAS